MGTALVTGASSGIGKELARRFAADGHDVILVARRLERLEELARELEAAHGVKSWPIACDLGEPAGIVALLGELSARELQVDFLVNNAGAGSSGPFAETDPERERELVELDVVSVVRLTRALLPGMLARGHGAILNLGSTAGFQPGPFMATYYASKAFVNHFTEALAYELRGTGVTATVFCPGPTATEFGGISGIGESNLFRLQRVASARSVAAAAYRAQARGRVLEVHGLSNWLATLLVRVSPRSWVRAVVARLNRPSRSARA